MTPKEMRALRHGHRVSGFGAQGTVQWTSRRLAAVYIEWDDLGSGWIQYHDGEMLTKEIDQWPTKETTTSAVVDAALSSNSPAHAADAAPTSTPPTEPKPCEPADVSNAGSAPSPNAC